MNKENLLQMYIAEQLADMYLLIADNYDKHIKNTGAIMDDLKAEISGLESKLAERNKTENTEGVLLGSFCFPEEFTKHVGEVLNIDTSKIQDDVCKFNIELLQKLAKYEKGEVGLSVEKDSGETDLEFYKRRVAKLEAKCRKQNAQIINLEEENGRLQAHVDTYKEYILPRATKEAYDMLSENQFMGIKIISCEEWAEKITEAKARESAIEQIDSILAELFGVAHSGYEYTDEFKELLRRETEGKISIYQDPVDIASDLIRVFAGREKNIFHLKLGSCARLPSICLFIAMRTRQQGNEKEKVKKENFAT